MRVIIIIYYHIVVDTWNTYDPACKILRNINFSIMFLYRLMNSDYQICGPFLKGEHLLTWYKVVILLSTISTKQI